MANTTYFSEQLSGKDQHNKYILSGIVKRTYNITEEKKCVLSNTQIPFTEDIIPYDDCPKIISQDLDIYPFKSHSDVIIKGKVRTPQKKTTFISEVQVGSHIIFIQVYGNRKVFPTTSGELRFTSPGVIEEVPLRYDYAYGGRDALLEAQIQLPSAEYMKYLSKDLDILEASPYRYKRNPEGKGFIVEKTKQSIEQLELPNLEDPEDLLTPENLIVKDPRFWYKMPLPRCTDWVSPSWFPRIAYFGFFNLPEALNYKIAEIKKGFVEQDILSVKPMKANVHARCTNGASLGLQLPYVKPGEKVRLINIHPKFKDFVFQLPTEYPDIWVDGRKGKLLPTKPVIHTIVIEPDENRVSIVWRGCGPALRPYMDEELKTMPYKVEWRK